MWNIRIIDLVSWLPALLMLLASAGVVDAAPGTKTSFPRLMGMNIGAKNYQSVEYQRQLARLNVVVLGFHSAWRGGGQMSIRSVVRALKQLNPQLLVGQYTILADAFDPVPRTHAEYDRHYKIERENWWLRHARGAKVTYTDEYATREVNITEWAVPDFNGQRYPKWLARRDFRTFFETVPEFDLWYFDNVFAHSRVKAADFDRDGHDDDSRSPVFSSAFRRGHVAHWDEARLLAPRILLMGNVDHGMEQPEYRGRLHGAFLEGLFGKEWSLERWAGWDAVMERYRSAMSNTSSPHLVGFNAWGDAGDFRAFRYAFASCLMDDGYFSYTDRQAGYSSVPWFDEYDFPLGAALEPPPLAPWQKGVYRREFENGMALVNPGSQPVTVELPPGFRRLRGTQAPEVNNGDSVTTLTLSPRDGLILRRAADDRSNLH